MPVGHTLDENTFALWRLDETDNSGWVDAAGRATLGSLLYTPRSTGPSIFNRTAKRLDINNAAKTTTTRSSEEALLVSTSPQTIECWVWMNAYPSADSTVVDFLDTGYLHGGIRTYVDAVTGYMGAFYAGGSAKASTPIPLNRWVHLAWRRYQEEDSSWSMDFWIDDTMIHKQAIGTPTPLNVLDCYWSIGIHPAAGDAGTWKGVGDFFISDVRVSLIKRTDEEIVASVDAAGLPEPTPSSTTGHTLDENTIALWHLNDESGDGAADETGSFNLELIGSTLYRTWGVGGGYARWFRESSGSCLRTASTIGETKAALFRGDVTVEAEVIVTPANDSGRIFSVAGYGSDVETLNALIEFGVTNDKLIAFWERDAGTNISVTSNITVPLNIPFHAACIRKIEDDGTCTVTFVLDDHTGNPVSQTIFDIQPPTGGDQAYVMLGGSLAGGGGISSPINLIDGGIDDIRVSNVIRTLEEIAESAASCARGAGAGAKPETPTISNFSPDEGTGLQQETSISVDVTTPQPDSLLSTRITIQYADGSIEPVYTGSDFTSLFSGTTTAITNGFTFSFHRLQDWQQEPTVLVEVFDTSGQLTTVSQSYVKYVPQPEVVTIIQARSVDARTLDVVFSKAPVTGEALNPSNYSISPVLTVESVVKMSGVYYRLKTSRQTTDQLYTVTVSGITT